MKRTTLKKSLTSQIALFVIAMMVLILGTVAVMMNSALKKELQNSLSAEAFHVEEVLENFLVFHKENITAFASDHFIVNSLVDVSGREQYLPARISNFVEARKVSAVTVVDFEGKTIRSSLKNPPDYLASTGLRLSLEAGRSQLALSTDRHRIIFIEPIFFYQTPQGAVIMEISLETFATPAVNPQKNLRYRLRNHEKILWDSPAQQGDFLAVHHASSPNLKLLPHLGLNLEIGTLQSSYLSLVRKVLAQLSLLGLIFITLSILLADKIASNIAKPILALCARVRDDDISTPNDYIPLDANNELDELAEAFAQRNIRLRQEMAERQKAEEKLLFTQFVVDHSTDSAFWIRPDGSLTYVNQSACTRLGFSHDELLAMSIHDIDPNFSDETWLSHWEEVKEKKFSVIETQHRAKDGALTPVEVAANYVTFKGQEYQCAFTRDISDRVKAEQEKLLLESQLRQAQKMEAIGTLAGGIAHDFNNILVPIIGYTEMVLGNLAPESKDRGFLDEVLKAANRAKELVQQILTFSRRAEQELKPLRIHLVIKEAIKLLRSSIPASIEIREDIDQECGAAMADPTQIHQLIMNLGTNAYHAMREKGGTLAIALHEITIGTQDYITDLQLAPGTYLKLEVSDTGHGMPSAILEKIFDPYFTTKKKGEGTGMGLAIVHGIVKNYKGKITVYSEPGKGTTFHVFLPSLKSEPVPFAIRRSEQLPNGNECILLVDDEEAIVKMEMFLLTSIGYQVDTMTSSSEAFSLFKSQPGKYDLLITDMTMPGMNGAELAKQVWAVRADIPVIICTGFSETINGEKAKALGISKYLMKPISHMNLALAVRETLNRKKP